MKKKFLKARMASKHPQDGYVRFNLKRTGKNFFKILFLFFIYSTNSKAQTVCPYAYFTLDGNLNSVSPATDISISLASNTETYSAGAVGNCLERNSNTLPVKGVSLSGISSPSINGFTVEMSVRFSKDFGLQRNAELFAFKDGSTLNAQVNFLYPNIHFYTTSLSQPQDEFIINLDGIGRKSYDYYMDGNWHHFIFIYDGSTGRKEVWVDGELPLDFFTTTSLSGPISSFGPPEFYISSGDPYAKFVGDIDEVAFYDQPIDGSKAISDYSSIATNNHIVCAYTTITSIPNPDLAGIYDDKEFPENYISSGYGSVAFQQDQLIAFPTARFKPGHSFLPNVNYTGCGYLAGGAPMPSNDYEQLSPNDPVPLSITMQEELAQNWNYYFNLSENTVLYTAMTSSYENAWVPFADAHPEYKRAAITNRAQMAPSIITSAALTAPHYINNTPPDWAPKPSLIMDYDGDGLTQKMYLKNILDDLPADRRIDLIAENNEVTHTYRPVSSPIDLISDASIVTEKGSMSWEEYQGGMKMQLDNRYRDAFMTSITELIDTRFLNYAVDGETVNRVNYEQLRQTQKQIDGQYYPTPDIYPLGPGSWHLINGDRHGWQWLMKSRRNELLGSIDYSDNRFAPYVAAGWDLTEENNMRPGQWLGFLKCMGLMGVDFYHVGFFNLGPTPNFANPKGWVWQLAPPVYAQAILSRGEFFFTDGHVMEGDIEIDPANSTDKGFRFNTGNANDIVVVRKMNSSDEYLISGSIQRVSNTTPATIHKATIKIPKNLSTNYYVTIPISTKGNTYYLKAGPGEPMCYQLDEWHQYEHPQYWTSDFEIEAELFDNNINIPQIHNDQLYVTPVADGLDFNLTKFVAYTGFGSAADVEYNFQPRQDNVANDYKFYVRARSKSGASTGMRIFCNAEDDSYNAERKISCITSTEWKWYTYDACDFNQIEFNGLKDNVHYALKLMNENNELEIDKIYLDSQDATTFSEAPESLASCAVTTISGPANYSSWSGSITTGATVVINGTFTIDVTPSSTITNVHFIMSSGSSIEIPSASSFHCFNCTFDACDEEWLGIVNNGDIDLTGCTVSKAQIGVKNQNRGTIYLFSTSFFSNRVGVYFDGGNFTSNPVKLCAFDGTGHKGKSDECTHIFLNHVENIVIGESGSQNTFGLGAYGIYSTASTSEIYNNSFDNIGYKGKAIDESAAIKIIDSYDENDKSIVGATSLGNTMKNYWNGVVSERTSIDIQNNSLDLVIRGIYITNSIRKNINILSNNLDRYSKGAYINNFLGGSLMVADNNFNKGNKPKVAMAQLAISISNPTASACAMNVENNKIAKSQIGIHAVNIPYGKIISTNGTPALGNEILYNDIPVAFVNGVSHTGIWLQNCESMEVSDNAVVRNYTPIEDKAVPFSRGIDVQSSPRVLVSENYVEGMGAGIRIFGACDEVEIKCNTMKRCYDGVNVEKTSAVATAWGDQGTSGQSWHNLWWNNAGPKRVNGNMTTPVLWYYYTPDGSQYTPSPTNASVATPTAATGTDTDCDNPGKGNAETHERSIAQIIHPFSNTGADASFDKMNNDQRVFSLVKNMIKNEDGSDNDVNKEKYKDLLSGNAGIIYSVEKCIEKNDTVLGKTTLASLQASNIFEENKKFTLQTYLDYYSHHEQPEEGTLQHLTEIAYTHPFYGGNAVYDARAMLGLLIDDRLDSQRIEETVDKKEVSTNYDYQLNPNPANKSVQITTKRTFDSKDKARIYDAFGKLVAEYKLSEGDSKFTIDLSDFKDAVYICKIMSDSEVKSTLSLVVIK